MITEQKPIVDRVRNNTMSVCQSRSSNSSGGPITAGQQQQKSFAGSFSIFDSTIGDEEFSFDDEIIKSHAYRRVVKGLTFRARARQHQDGQSAEIEDGQDPSRLKDEPTNMQQGRTLSPVNNSENGGGMEEEQRILEERSVRLASKVQEQQDELRKLQEQLRQLEKRASQTSSQEPKQNSEVVKTWGKDNLPVENRGGEDSMLLTPGIADKVEDPSLSSDKKTFENNFAHLTDHGANATLQSAPGTPVSTLLRGGTLQQNITANELVHTKSEPSLPLESTKSVKSSRNSDYEDLDETADGHEPKNEVIHETVDGEAFNTLVTSAFGSSEALRSLNTVILPQDLGGRIPPVMPSEPTSEMQNIPECLSAESSVQWLVSPEAYIFKADKLTMDAISSMPPSLKVVLLGSMCGKTSALLTYARQTPVLASYDEITYYDEDYHMKLLLTFQAHSEEVNLTVTDTEDYLGRNPHFNPRTFEDADALVLGYSIGDHHFDDIKDWVSA